MVNDVTLIGNSGRDAELRTTTTGKQFCTFTLATSDRYQGADGEWREDTEWHKIKLYGRSAERIAGQVKKGDRVYLKGSISSYELDGVIKVEIKAFKVLVLTAKIKHTDQPTGGFLPPSETSKLDPWSVPKTEPWSPSKATWGNP